MSDRHAPQDIRYSLWVSKDNRLPPRQISEEVRLERELELIHYRRQERQAWEQEKIRLGLDKLGR